MALSAVQPLTYIQLVQTLFREVGAAGVAGSTIIGAKGEFARLVGYVHDAELDIQNLQEDWKWRRKTLSFYTKANDQTGIYTDATGTTSAYPLDLAEWDFKTFQIYPAGSTQSAYLPTFEWQLVRNQVFDLTDKTQPWRAIVMPDNTFRWDLIPDQAYQCFGEYRAVPYDLKVDADVSQIPARFANRIIIEMARYKYGTFENAPEQLARATRELYGFQREDGNTEPGMVARLENDQLYNNKNARFNQGNEIVISTDYGSNFGGYDSWGY